MLHRIELPKRDIVRSREAIEAEIEDSEDMPVLVSPTTRQEEVQLDDSSSSVDSSSESDLEVERFENIPPPAIGAEIEDESRMYLSNLITGIWHIAVPLDGPGQDRRFLCIDGKFWRSKCHCLLTFGTSLYGVSKEPAHLFTQCQQRACAGFFCSL